jgi:hypothetical protein
LPPRCGSSGSNAAHCVSLSQNRSPIIQALPKRLKQTRRNQRNRDKP